MSTRINRRTWRRLTLFAILMATRLPILAQETRWLTLWPSEIFTRVEVEAERESRTPANSGQSTTIERLFVAPTLGAELKGAAYHPNLFFFDLRGEGGYGWQDLKSTSGSFSSSTTDETFLQRYDITAIFLRSKPYAVTFDADKIHTFRDLDFFHRVTVDSQSYGGKAGYTAGPVPFTVAAKHLEEEQLDQAFRSTLDQNTLEFQARNERRQKRSSTDLFYNYGDYERRTSDVFTDNGTYHYATLYDVEHWGEGDRAILNSTVTYNEVDSTNLPSQDFSIAESLLLQHGRNLQSFYDYNFNTSSSGPVDSLSNYGRAGLRHQLFESLNSTLDAHVGSVTTEGLGGSQDQFRYGVGLNEVYTKRLGSWGRLTIADSARFDREDRDVNGVSLTIINEAHTLQNDETLLNQPNVTSVISVADATNVANVYVLNVDYRINPIGSLVQIQRIPGHIPNDNIVVTYNFALGPGQGKGSFDTFADQFSVRLDLFKGLLAFYSRLNWIENYGGEQFVLEDLFSTQSGAEVAWRWIRAGGEYETHDSTFITYNSINTYQSFTFTPTDASTLTLDLRQRWTRYPVENRRITDYAFTTRYHLRITRHLYYLLEGGVRWEEGDGTDQRQAVARSELDFQAGKLKVLLGYEYNNDDIRNDLRDKHFVYLRAKRTF